MRDEHQLQEEERRFARHHVAGMTLAGVIAVGAVFALGFFLGQRVARVEAPSEAAFDPLAKLDGERRAADNLTFYAQLTAARPKNDPAPPGPPAERPAERLPESPPRREPLPEPGVTRPAAPSAVEPQVATNNLPRRIVPSGPPKANPEQAGALQALSAGPAQRGDYTVQVSSFHTKQEAKAFSSALERKGFRPFVVEASLPSRGTWYRVRLGRFSTEEDARLGKAVLAKSDIPAWVLRSE